DQPVCRVVVEYDDVVDVAERRQELGALCGRHQRTPRALQARHRGVRVDADEEHVAEPPGGAKVAEVADVQEVETAVREDDASARWIGTKVVAPSRSKRAMPRLPRVTRRTRASSRSSSWRPAFSTLRSSSTGMPVSCSSSASLGVAAVAPPKRGSW